MCMLKRSVNLVFCSLFNGLSSNICTHKIDDTRLAHSTYIRRTYQSVNNKESALFAAFDTLTCGAAWIASVPVTCETLCDEMKNVFGSALTTKSSYHISANVVWRRYGALWCSTPSISYKTQHTMCILIKSKL